MSSILALCPHCQQHVSLPLQEKQDLHCPLCTKRIGRMEDLGNLFETCPVCPCRQFYVQKDFNRGLGCLIIAVGILLVPATYGLSLPLFALLDWLLYRRVPTMVICYRCGSEFRDVRVPGHLKPYMHHIGLKYDKYR